MASLFGSTFLSVGEGLLIIFIIAGISAVLTHRKVISAETVNGLSRLTVYVFLPSMIFHTITTEFDPLQQPYWWKIPLIAVAMASSGLLLSWLLFLRRAVEKKSYFPVASMQNAVYLVLPIGEFVYPGQFEEFALICFLVVLGLSPFMWTAGKVLLTRDSSKKKGLGKILTPPFIANILSIILVLTGVHVHIPNILTETTSFIGKATLPVATFILGASLVVSLDSIPVFKDTLRVVSVKFLLLPLLTIFFLQMSGTGSSFPLLADVLIIQSASAPATAHILQIRTYGGNLKATGGLIFVSYIVCLFAIPFWLTVWKVWI